MNCEHLFQPITIRNMTLRNRVMLPGMSTRLCHDGGFVSDDLIAHYVAIARGGCGLVVIEATSVHQPTAPWNFMQICTDEHIPGLKKLTEAVHAEGAKISVQLWQGGFAATATDPKIMPIVPSDVEFRGMLLKGVSKETIAEVVQAYGAAAKRAVEAGFDSVDLHFGHQYSPHHFLSGAFNKRTDEYGGDLAGRARYAMEIIKAVRENVPEDFPVGMRIVAQDDHVEGGNTIEDQIQFVKWAAEAGVDFANVSRGNKFSAAFRFEVPCMYQPKGFNLDNAAKIKAAVNIPIAGGGRLVDPEQAEEYVGAGKLDMVFVGRPQICDPEWCNKAKEGRLEDLVRCISCNQGCLDNVQQAGGSKHVTCLRNPFAGHWNQRKIVKTETPKKVIVVGGGMGGMEAAYVLKQKGHNAILCEASDHLGGQFVLAGKAPAKENIELAAVSRAEQITRYGVDVRLNTVVDKAYLDAEKPDAVIVATGAKPIQFKVPGVDGDNVHSYVDVLTGKTDFTGSVVVIGGGLVGLESAFYLAQRGCQVSVVEMQERIGMDISGGQMIDTMIHIQMAKLNQVPKAKCVEITKEGVIVEIEGERKTVAGDNVVVAVGSKTVDHGWLEAYCTEKGIECKVIGDANSPRRCLQAIEEGVDAALAI